MVSRLSCILHIGGNVTGDIKQFDDSLWSKVHFADTTRRKLFKDSKYFTIKLPENYKETDGYHVQCYKKYTAVPQGTIEGSSEASTKQHHTRSDADNLKISTSGIFARVCLFCNQATKSLGKNKAKEKKARECEVVSGAQTIKGHWF